jgi:hypothetical protein
MKKLILMLMLAVISNVAVASEDWAPVANDADSTLYLPTTTDQITEDGYVVTMWDLTDFVVAQPVDNLKFISIKVQREYDCLKERTRSLSIITYAGHMGTGRVVASTDIPDDWVTIAPHTRGALKFETVCEMYKQ